MTLSKPLAIYIKADNSSIRIEETKRLTLEQLQEAVGGYIERVPVKVNGKRAWMWVNEEGKLRGLPINDLATATTAASGTPQLIVGDVVITLGVKT